VGEGQNQLWGLGSAGSSPSRFLDGALAADAFWA